jgi:DnaJ-class molecular chaperone
MNLGGIMDTKQCVDYYEILEVHQKASAEIIEKAYKTLAKRYHPDLHPIYKKAWAEEMFKALKNAYEILANPSKRAKYDYSHAYTKNEQNRKDEKRSSVNKNNNNDDSKRNDSNKKKRIVNRKISNLMIRKITIIKFIPD